MHRILDVCSDCGLLSHSERVTYRNRPSETRRIADIEPEGSVRVTALYEKYGLKVNPRVLPRLKSMADQFAYALNVHTVSIEVDGNVVYVRVPRSRSEEGDTLTFERAWRIDPKIPRGGLLLGMDEEQDQLLIDLTSPTVVHAAVVGMTGSGKSTLMKSMILSCEMRGGVRVALFDPSGGFLPLSGHPSVWRGGLFRTAPECERGLAALARSIGKGMDGLTYVFVDEVPELIMQEPRIRDHLSRLAQAGRHAGIHLVIGAQHPLASQLGPLTMRNIPLRLIGRVADGTAAYHAAGRSDTGAENLTGRGDFVVVNGSTLRHFQAAFVSLGILKEWARRYPPRPPRVPVAFGEGAVATSKYSAHAAGRNGGRPKDTIPDHVIEEIQRFVVEEGAEPSSNWVYRVTRSMLPSGGFNRAKAQRAIEVAVSSMDR